MSTLARLMKAPIKDNEEREASNHEDSGAVSSPSSRGDFSFDTKSCLLVIFGTWIGLILLLLVLQLAGGTGMGLKVWPMGEDRTWIHLLQNNHGVRIARAFWLINDRNPLSPWWYFLVSPLVMHFDYGIYLVRKLVDLILAASTYMLFARLFARPLRPLALVISLLVLVWNFSFYYTEQIMWNFLIALAATNFSIWSYLKFIDSRKTQAGYSGASLVFYFLAFASYSIQCGAPLAIFCLSFVRHDRSSTVVARFLNAIRDTASYAALFFLFTLTWITASRPSSDYYALSPALVLKQFGPSLQSLLWQSDYAPLMSGILESWAPAAICGASVVFLVVSFFGFKKIIPANLFSTETPAGEFAENLLATTNGITGDTSMAPPSPSSSTCSSPSSRQFVQTARDLFIVVAAISIPTLLLESMSSVWFPGTRVRMIAQEVTPCLMTLLFAGIALLISRQKKSVGRIVFLSLTTVACSSGILMGLQYNKQLCTQTLFERNLAKGLKPLVNPALFQQYFLIKLDGVKWECSPFLNDTCIQTFFHNKFLSMRVLQTVPAPESFEKQWRVKFGDERAGVKNADFSMGEQRVPWKQAVFVTFDGKKVRVVNPIRPSDLAGLQADFEAVKPIAQIPTLPSLSTIKGKP